MASQDNLTVTASDDDPNSLVVVGQIDAHTSSALEDGLSALNEDVEITVDLSEVTFVDSSGLRVLVRSHRKQLAGGGRLRIHSPSEPVRRLLDITGLTSELTITS